VPAVQSLQVLKKGMVIYMKNIAVYVNDSGVTSSITSKGSIRIYAKADITWKITDEIPCGIDFTSGLAQVRRNITEIIIKLTDCKVFVAAEIYGQLYYILEANHFNSYEAAGEPELFLDSILENELSETQNASSALSDAAPASIEPEATDQCGIYTIHLKKVLALNPELSSKKVLKPFLQEKKFEVLEVLCDHEPRWFETDLKAMGLSSTAHKTAENEYRISITPNK